MPYKIALIDDDNDPFFIVDTIIDFMFLTDIVINFNSALLLKNGAVNYHRKKITMDYIKTWFFIDLVASLPTGLL